MHVICAISVAGADGEALIQCSEGDTVLSPSIDDSEGIVLLLASMIDGMSERVKTKAIERAKDLAEIVK